MQSKVKNPMRDPKVRRVLRDVGVPLSVLPSEPGDTPLHRAAEGGHTEIATALIEAGADVTAINPSGHSAFYLAIAGNHLDTVQYLVAQPQTNFNTPFDNSFTPLALACSRGSFEVAEYLIKQGAEKEIVTDDGNVVSLVSIALENGSSDIAKLLLSSGANPTILEPESNSTLLHTSALHGHADVLSLLLRSKLKKMLNAAAYDGSTALHYSVLGESLECVALLLDEGADLNIQDEEGFTALQRAVGAENFEAISMLVEAGAEVNTLTKNGLSTLDIAIGQHKVEFVPRFGLRKGDSTSGTFPRIVVGGRSLRFP
jgi:ankyrin repeat protein